MSQPLRALALTITALGDSGYMFASSALVAAMAWWGYRSTQDRQLRAELAGLQERALQFFAVIAASGLAAQALKHLIGRARPKSGDLGPFAFHPLSLSNAYASFPSGHATSAFAAATALGLMTSRGRRLLLGLAVAIGFSRVVLREHYPSDVLVGAALGTTVALGVTRAFWPSAAIQRLRASWIAPFGASDAASRYDWTLAFGQFCSRHRRWFPPALIAGVFAIAVPPEDLFGSEVAEHVKDSCAVVIALAGLTARALTVGYAEDAEPQRDQPVCVPRLKTEGLYSLCRHPLYVGNMLIFTGIFLMHGNRWTVLFGPATYALVHLAIVKADEADLRSAFGTTYDEYCRRVPRWWPRPVCLAQVAGGWRFALHRMLKREYAVIGLTVIALTAAEFYEEIQEPLVGGQILYVALLGATILGVGTVLGTLWLAEKARLRSP